jgi:16S rRNA (uracil1498-N3)-methyltransferase
VSEAAKQCGRTMVPQIQTPRSFAETLAVRVEGARKIFLREREEAKGLKDSLEMSSAGVFVLVGPEGGLSEGEAMQAREAGFCPVRLGPRILRAETAGIVVVGLLQFLLGDLG